jgi:hypothetical protein
MPNMPYMPGGTPVYGAVPQPQAWPSAPPTLPPAPQPLAWAPKPPQAAPPSTLSAPQKLALPPPPALAAAQAKPIVRGAMPDSPAAPPPPTRIVLPSPEALGIKIGPATPPAAPDWNHVHARLEKLGTVNYQRDRLSQGGYRVILSLPAHRVEATGDTEAAAVLLALERAENLVQR